MKHLSNIWILIIGIFGTFISGMSAQNIILKTGDMKVSISPDGYYKSVKVCGNELLQSTQYPFLIAGLNKQLIMPKASKRVQDNILLTMNDGEKIVLKIKESNLCITFEVTEIPTQYDVLLFGPLTVNINEVVGDIIGVAQGGNVAFGFQSLNIKTNAGIPLEYSEQIKRLFNYEGVQAQLSVGSIPDYRQAATKTSHGTMFQFSCRNRTREEYRQVQQIKESLTLPVEGEDAVIKGAKIAMFGSPRDKALERIGQIEIEQGLPHPMFNGEWAKTARSAMSSYLISDFSEDNLDWILNKAKIADFKYIYHSDPFKDWGHFNWNPKFTKQGDDGVKKIVNRAKAQGIGVGAHSLSNFITTNDTFVTPIPSKHLLKQGSLVLTEDLNEKQSEIHIKKSDLFAMTMTLNALQIDDELITYGSVEEKEDGLLLKNCIRGAFGTTASEHVMKTPLYKLWDYPYKTLFPDITLQDKLADRLAQIFNKTGLCMLSFDGLEGCLYTGQDDYATARFVTNFHKQLKQDILNDASNLNHYMWHIHSRMNWGGTLGRENAYRSG